MHKKRRFLAGNTGDGNSNLGVIDSRPSQRRVSRTSPTQDLETSITSIRNAVKRLNQLVANHLIKSHSPTAILLSVHTHAAHHLTTATPSIVFAAMESLLSLSFDNIASKNDTKIRKGLRQIEGLLAQICLSKSAASSPSKRKSSVLPTTGSSPLPPAKKLGDLVEDPAFREFFRLQEGFEWNGTASLKSEVIRGQRRPRWDTG